MGIHSQSQNKSSIWSFIAQIAAIYSILGFIVGITTYHTSPEYDVVIWSLAGILALIFLAFMLMVFYFEKRRFGQYLDKIEKQKDRINSLSKEIDKLRIQVFKPEKVIYKRFESFWEENQNLTYGYVEYRPFFWLDNNKTEGIGDDLLKEIFAPIKERGFKLEPYHPPIQEEHSGNRWDTVFEDLENHKYNIIATPLFETRTRLYRHNVLFCTPIFYSNIGIYIREYDFTSIQLDFKNAIKFLGNKVKEDGWKPEYIPGEISYTLAKK